MVIPVPRYRSIPDDIKAATFEKVSCDVAEWDIGVARSDDIPWSIVLSYLISANPRTLEDFKNRLMLLTDSTKNLSDAKKGIQHYNPFRNRYSCFYNETLKMVVEKFKQKLHWNQERSLFRKLQKTSNFLRCPLLLLNSVHEGFESHMFEPDVARNKKLITLFADNEVQKEVKCKQNVAYSFGIGKDLGWKMKKSALRYFLREVKIPSKNIKKILSKFDYEEHFLMQLLKLERWKDICSLYDSPYFVCKLSDAGFETNPLSTVGTEISAISYALVMCSSKVLYKLYNSLADNFDETEGCCSNKVLSNLVKLRDVLLKDETKLKALGILRNKVETFKKFQNFLRLIDFNITLLDKLMKLRNDLNYYDSIEEKVFQANNARNIIITIFEVYKDYLFEVPGYSENEEIPPNSLKDYALNKDYYYMIDSRTYTSFFSNIFYLKSRLKPDSENDYSEMESSLLQYSFFNFVLNPVSFVKSTEKIFVKELEIIYAILLLRRLSAFDKMKEFCKMLQNIHPSDENTVQCIPGDEVLKVLITTPVLKESIKLQKLKKYMEVITDLKVNDTKSVLVVERAFQVMGEYLSIERENDASFAPLLILSLPRKISQRLRRIRNILSHLENYDITLKLKSETNYSFFSSVKNEIIAITHCFKPLFKVAEMPTFLDLLNRGKQYLEQIRNSPISANIPNFLEVFNMLCMILKIIPAFIFQKHVSEFLCSFENFITRLEKESRDDPLWKDSTRSKQMLWPLQYLLKLHLMYYETLKEYPTVEELQPVQCLFQPGISSLSVIDLSKLQTHFDEIDRERQVGMIQAYDNISDADSAFLFITECKCYYEILKKRHQKRKRKGKRKTANEEENFLGIEQFCNILKGFYFLSEGEKERIRSSVPPSVVDISSVVKTLVLSLENNATLSDEDREAKFEKLQTSKTKLKKLRQCYECNDASEARNILNGIDLTNALETALENNRIGGKEYNNLCETLQLPEESRKLLYKIVDGQKKREIGNNLLSLSNRVHLLRTILIEEDVGIRDAWSKIKSRQAKQHVTSKIVKRFNTHTSVAASVEILVIDCLTLFKKEKLPELFWLKKDKLYSGVDLRHVLCHGNPLLETLCPLLDPNDLPSEITDMAMKLIEDEDSILALLELYGLKNQDYTQFQQALNADEDDEFSALKTRIFKCDTWKEYSQMPPR